MDGFEKKVKIYKFVLKIWLYEVNVFVDIVMWMGSTNGGVGVGTMRSGLSVVG